METEFQRQAKSVEGGAQRQNNYNRRQQQFVQSPTQSQYRNRPTSESPSSSDPRDPSHSYRQSYNFQQHSQANFRSPQQLNRNNAIAARPFTLSPQHRQSDNQDGWQLWDEQEANYPESDQQQRRPAQREQRQQVLRDGYYTGNSQPRSPQKLWQSSAQPARRPPQFQSNKQREFLSDGYQQQVPYSPWKYVQGGRTMQRNSAQFAKEDWAMPPRNQVGFNSSGNTHNQPFNRRSNYQTTSPTPNYQQRLEPQFRV